MEVSPVRYCLSVDNFDSVKVTLLEIPLLVHPEATNLYMTIGTIRDSLKIDIKDFKKWCAKNDYKPTKICLARAIPPGKAHNKRLLLNMRLWTYISIYEIHMVYSFIQNTRGKTPPAQSLFQQWFQKYLLQNRRLIFSCKREAL